jgi:hypothetical protein
MEAFKNKSEVENLMQTLCVKSWESDGFKNKLVSSPKEKPHA